MKNWLNVGLVASVLLIASSAASNASTILTGSISNSGTLTNDYDLNLSSLSNIDVALTSTKLNNFYVTISGGVLTPEVFHSTLLYKNISLDAFSTTLAAGDYTLAVTGTPTSSNGGAYAGVEDVSAVPLPPALPMFGAALIGLASFSIWRRKGKDEKTVEVVPA